MQFVTKLCLYVVCSTLMFNPLLAAQSQTPDSLSLVCQSEAIIEELLNGLEKISGLMDYWHPKTSNPEKYPLASQAYADLESFFNHYGKQLGRLLLMKKDYNETNNLENRLQLVDMLSELLKPSGITIELYEQSDNHIIKQIEASIELYRIPENNHRQWLYYGVAGVGILATSYALLAHRSTIADTVAQSGSFLKNNFLIPCKDMISWIFDNKPLANSSEHHLQNEATYQGVKEYLERYHRADFPSAETTYPIALEERTMAIMKGSDNTLLHDLNAHGPNTLWNLLTPSAFGGGYLGHLFMVMFMKHKCQFNTYITEADNIRNAIKWTFGLSSLSLATIFGFFSVKSGQAIMRNYNAYSSWEIRQLINKLYLVLNTDEDQTTNSEQTFGLTYFYVDQLRKKMQVIGNKERTAFMHDIEIMVNPTQSARQKRSAIKHWYRHYSFLRTPQNSLVV